MSSIIREAETPPSSDAVRGTISTSPTLYTQIDATYKCFRIDEFSLDKQSQLVQTGKDCERKFFLEDWMDHSRGGGGGPLHVDLLDGLQEISSAGRKADKDGGLNKMFQWLMAVTGPGSCLQQTVHGPRILVRRGLLARLAVLPYTAEARDDAGHALAMVKYKGVYFMREFLTIGGTEPEEDGRRTRHNSSRSKNGGHRQKQRTSGNGSGGAGTGGGKFSEEEFRRRIGIAGARFKQLVTTTSMDGGSGANSSQPWRDLQRPSSTASFGSTTASVQSATTNKTGSSSNCWFPFSHVASAPSALAGSAGPPPPLFSSIAAAPPPGGFSSSLSSSSSRYGAPQNPSQAEVDNNWRSGIGRTSGTSISSTTNGGSSSANGGQGQKKQQQKKSEYNAIFAGVLRVPCRKPVQLLCAARIDCTLAGNGEFLDLRKQFNHMGFGKGFATKALIWYFDSHVVGMKRFVVGVHEQCESWRPNQEENGILKRVEKHEVSNLLKWSREGGWDPQVCMAFLHAFLARLQAELDKQAEGCILVVERSARQRQFKFRVINPQDTLGQRQWGVLSEEFKDFGWL